ncbi:MAG TPA: hypothetical protein VJP80_02705 [Candidatus Saccharimonadales bacterium]|nr:hypothetical protein [Candidatus Saccharimonadales bacterium]
MKRFTSFVFTVFASRRFLYAVFGFFVFESVWIALSARYPMAFDEDFHLGIIKIYSHHWLPFLHDQPANSGALGAVARDPSYLYHYLMSFPYRLIAACTQSQAAQIIVLRLLNVALFGLGLGLFYRVLRQVGTSRALANVTLALFVLIPIVPLLAGQINYDNLLLPLTAWTCLLTIRAYRQLAERRVPLKTLSLLIIVGLLSSIVKYAFLPIWVASLLFIAWHAWRTFRGRRRELRRELARDHDALSNKAKLGLLLALLVASFLFMQRYVMNVVSYHAPIPDCAAVIGEDECMNYGPWARDYEYAQAKGNAHVNPFIYPWWWLCGMMYRLFFMINGPASDYNNYPPLPLPTVGFVVVAVASVLALAVTWRRLFRHNGILVFFVLLGLLYVGLLAFDEFREYLKTGQPVAINGRYLLPVLLPLAAVGGQALSRVLRKRHRVKVYAALVVLLLFVQGGGVMSFIVRSDTTWYWQSPTVIRLNRAAHAVVNPLIYQ